MYKSQWTTLVMISLIAITLAGCAVPGRFNREQYAQLDSDPFISEEPERATVLSQVADRAASLTSKKSAEPMEDRFAFVADEEFSDSAESESLPATPVAENQNDSEDALASFFEVEVPKQIAQAVDNADDEFSQFMTNQKSQVVHASAEFIDTVESAQDEVRQTVDQSAFWGLPANQLMNSAETTPLREVPTNNNPFFDDDNMSAEPVNPFEQNSSVPTVAPPADVFGDTSGNASWPPGDFEFN